MPEIKPNCCHQCGSQILIRKQRRGARGNYCSTQCVRDKLETFAHFDVERCGLCNEDFPDKKKGTQRYCTPECSDKAERLYHALYDSLPEQIERRTAYLKNKKG